MANVEMMQQGGIRAAQGTLSAFGNILGSMAGQNKQARGLQAADTAAPERAKEVVGGIVPKGRA